MYLLIVVLTIHSLQARGTTKFVVVDFYCTRYFSVLSRILKQLTDVAKIRDIFYSSCICLIEGNVCVMLCKGQGFRKDNTTRWGDIAWIDNTLRRPIKLIGERSASVKEM